MKRFFIFFIILINFNCTKKQNINIDHINGYWEIKKVILVTGEEHEYNYNIFIDYIELTDSLTGFRKKLKPKFDGTFEASKDTEQFKIKIENDSVNLYYHTNFSDWKETVLLASKTELKIINKAKNIYIYKPYEPINLN
jgi:hypothetical protein